MDDMHLQLCGWAGEDEAKQAWQAIGSQFPTFTVFGDTAATATVEYMPLFEITRKVLGKDPINYAQAVGDCVSWGARNVVNTLAAQEIFAGDAEEWRDVYPPYFYGTGRVLVGRGQLGRGDGSLGSWQAKAVELYGAIPADGEGVPAYSGAIARQWGNSGPPQQFVAQGKKNLIQTTARVFSAEEGADAIVNGHPFTIACNQGFEYKARSDGFHWPSGTWAHQMAVICVDRRARDPYFGVLNSWGDVHGVIQDFHTNTAWPKGMLRVRWEVMDRMLRTGEGFAYSRFQGFPAQTFSSADLF